MAKQLDHNDYAKQYSGQHVDDTIFTLGQFYRYENGVWSPINDYNIGKEIKDTLERDPSANITSPMISSVAQIVRYELYKPDNCIDTYPNLINMLNGMYDIDTGDLLTHNPKFYSTYQLNFPYDKTATCPNWKRYLDTTLVKDPRETGAKFEQDPELINFVQEAVGYSLTDEIKYHVMFWCFGKGRNGKGTLFETIEKLSGSGVATINLNLLHKEQYQLANLVGKRVALCNEANSTDNLVEDATIKSLVAGDTITVRMIRREPFDLKPKLKLWWSMNRLPAVADTSVGFWSRMRVIPFHRVFEGRDKDPDLKDKIFDELPGIFNWAMCGLDRLKIRGGFETPKQVERFTDIYQKESNPVMLFIEEKYRPDLVGSTSSSSLYCEYKNWSVDNGYKPMSSRNFKREVELLGYYLIHTNAGNQYKGLVSKP